MKPFKVRYSYDLLFKGGPKLITYNGKRYDAFISLEYECLYIDENGKEVFPFKQDPAKYPVPKSPFNVYYDKTTGFRITENRRVFGMIPKFIIKNIYAFERKPREIKSEPVLITEEQAREMLCQNTVFFDNAVNSPVIITNTSYIKIGKEEK